MSANRVPTNPLFRFALVGSIGFLVDSLVFALVLYGAHWSLMLARVAAFVCAATTTWLGNRHFTFSASMKEGWKTQWLKSFSSALFSAIPNLLFFHITVQLLGQHGIAPMVALVVGVLAGMISNFTLSKFWVFRLQEKRALRAD